jgi:anthranilate/para-aminobenzoate synthase component I
MGAIGCSIPTSLVGNSQLTTDNYFDLSVAIRTMVVRGGEAIFNVGGGIVIDSDPEEEYKETLTKARAILKAIGADYWIENQID